MRDDHIERRIPWPRDRFWRPGEPITLELDGATVTFRLRGVMRDGNPASPYATVRLEPVRALDEATDGTDEGLSAAG